MADLTSKQKFYSKLDRWSAAPRNRVIRIFLDVDFRCSHNGLIDIARRSRCNVDNLAPGDYLIFVNRNQSSLKMLTAFGSTVAHFKLPGQSKLDVRVLKDLPRFFSGGQINYAGAIGKQISDALGVTK